MSEKWYQLALEADSNPLTLGFKTEVLCHCIVPRPYWLTLGRHGKLKEHAQTDSGAVNCFVISLT